MDIEVSGSNITTNASSHDVVFFPIMMPYLICPALSSLASFVMITLILVSKFHKESLGIMLLSVNIADFLFCFPKAMTYLIRPWDDAFCRLVQFVSHAGLISSVIWGFLFAHAMLKVITKQKFEVIRELLKPYILLSVILPVILSAQCLFSDYIIYHDDTNTCIHKVQAGVFDYKSLLFTGIPIVTCCVLSLIWYSFAAKMLKNFMNNSNAIYTWTLVIYPAILLICWMPSLMMNSLITFGMKPNAFLLEVFQALDQTQGFWNAVVYGISKGSVRRAISRFCCWKVESDPVVHRGIKVSLIVSDSEDMNYSDISPHNRVTE